MLHDMMRIFQRRLAQISLMQILLNDHEIQDFDDDASEVRPNVQHLPHNNRNYAPPPQQLNLQVREHNKWESRFRLDVPKFHGTHNAKGFLDWLTVAEEAFDSADVLANERVYLAATMFRGRTSARGDLSRCDENNYRRHQFNHGMNSNELCELILAPQL